METNRFYIIDCGDQMREYCHYLKIKLRVEGANFIIYDTDAPYYLALEEVTEDVFLSHFQPKADA
jgi:hypothetical protein